MRPGQQQNKRMRGRGRKGPNPLSRSYESNGPDVKIRGTAQHIAEKYSTLARDAAASGDRVMAENYLQHAEHYGRIVAAAQGSFQLQQDENDGSDQYDDEGEEEVGFTNGNGQSYPQERVQQDRGQQQERVQQDRGQQDRGQQDRGQPQQDRNQNLGDRGNQQPAMRESRDANREQRDGNREARGNRDANGNRDNNRDGRDGNRDNRGNREGNRDGRDNGRENHQGRDTRENRDRNVPSGLGPQPFLPEAPRTQPEPAPAAMRNDEFVRDQPTQEQPVRDEFRARTDEPNAEREPRRRGRPRRIRSDEAAQPVTTSGGDAVEPAAPVAAPAPAQAVAPHFEAQPMSAPVATQPVSDVAADGEAKVKRKPGRPRKKKPEDETSGGGDDGGDGGGHLPAFLMASNG